MDIIQSLGVQNSKASKVFDSQPLGCVICSNHIDYNLIILIFKGDVLINFDPPRVGTSLMDAPLDTSHHSRTAMFLWAFRLIHQ